jgi:hypothetical protein
MASERMIKLWTTMFIASRCPLPLDHACAPPEITPAGKQTMSASERPDHVTWSPARYPIYAVTDDKARILASQVRHVGLDRHRLAGRRG